MKEGKLHVLIYSYSAPLIGFFSLVVQQVMLVDCFMKGQVLQGVLQGPEPFAMLTGFISNQMILEVHCSFVHDN